MQARRNNNNSNLPANGNPPAQPQPRELETYVHRPSADLPATAETLGITDRIDQFWGSRRQLEAFHHHIAPPLIELVLLRRLGPPMPAIDGGTAYEQLSALYRQVTAEALTLAYATEADEEIAE